MFFLRCAFWLMIVYASMSWTTEALVSSGKHAVEAPVSAAVDGALAGLGDLCRRQPARCVADAAKLTALIDAGSKAADQDLSGSLDKSAPERVPMPVPDPRRHARPTVLTRSP